MLCVPFRVVIQDHLERLQHGHAPFGLRVQRVAHKMLQQFHIHKAVILGNADRF